jgi:predicted nicotinamide N-methyase
MQVNTTTDQRPFITVHDVPIYFQEDWESGIGGGLWSTGLAMAEYLGTEHALSNIQQRLYAANVLELGSGNGLLAMCLAAAASHAISSIQNIVITDTKEHISLIEKTVRANKHAIGGIQRIIAVEHLWGEFHDQTDNDGTLESAVKQGTIKFDLILGSDVAYRPDELYDPLIASILQFSHENTVCLIGVTMVDTTPEFFAKLDCNGLQYRKLADHLLTEKFRGTTFAIFTIRRKPTR